MPSPLRLVALDAALDLVLPSDAPEAFHSAVRQAWSRCLARPDRVSPSVTAEPLAVTSPTEDSPEAVRHALQRLSQDVTHRLIAAQTGRLLMFHAGAVCDPESGVSVVFVAPSGTGKTTLARLLARTHGYLTDETVGIDPATGRVHPYPKPLSISISPSERWRKVETSPDALGLLPAHPTPTVARVVLLNRAHDKGTPVHAEDLQTLDAVAALIPETSALNRLPRPLHMLAELLERTAPLVRLTYREASDLVPLVSELIEDEA